MPDKESQERMEKIGRTLNAEIQEEKPRTAARVAKLKGPSTRIQTGSKAGNRSTEFQSLRQNKDPVRVMRERKPK